jgi:hypothetical protein
MVQTFIVEETKELIYDADKIEEWKSKCEELGLSEQLSLAQPEKSPIPFVSMNTVMNRVYTTLCPEKVDYKRYRKTAIPLEVLSLIALAEKEKYFTEIQIWYDDRTPDPLAVGILKKQEWSHDLFLIARWGDVMRPFDELKEKAIQVYKNTSIIQLKRSVADANEKIANIDNNVALYFDAQIDAYSVSNTF